MIICSVLSGSEYDEEEAEYEESDSDESWTTESAISSESILSSMCMNGGDEKPFACPVPGCKKRYKVKCFKYLFHLSVHYRYEDHFWRLEKSWQRGKHATQKFLKLVKNVFYVIFLWKI